jgi:1-acyl-sn-glycerol-3-phosphate acyltransferase
MTIGEVHSLERQEAGTLHRTLLGIGTMLRGIKYPYLKIKGAEHIPEAGVVAVSPHYRKSKFFEFVYLAVALQNEERNLNKQCAVAVKPAPFNYLERIVTVLGDVPLVAATSNRKGMERKEDRDIFNENNFYKPGISYAQYMPVLLYPQGHRLLEHQFLKPGEGLKFHPGAAIIAQRASAPLVSAVVWGHDRELSIDIRPIDVQEYTGDAEVDYQNASKSMLQVQLHYKTMMREFMYPEM